MRISDWSSDVCSSDLLAKFRASLGNMSAMGSLLSGGDEGRKHAKACLRGGSNRLHFRRPNPGRLGIGGEHALADGVAPRSGEGGHVDGEREPYIGRASCGDGGCQYV